MKTLIKKALIHCVAFANDDADIMARSFNYRTETITNQEAIRIAKDQEIIAAEKSYALNTFLTKGIYVTVPLALTLLVVLLSCAGINYLGCKILSYDTASALGISFILLSLYVSIYLITLPNYKLPEITKYICYLKNKFEETLLLIEQGKTSKTKEKIGTFNPLVRFPGTLTELTIIFKLFEPIKRGATANIISNHIADKDGNQYNYNSIKSTKSQLEGNIEKDATAAVDNIIESLKKQKN